MKLVLFLLLIASLAAIGAQTIKTRSLLLGETAIIYSAILNEHRKILIYPPEQYDETEPNKTLYPVVYLFDGGAHFARGIDAIKQLRKVNEAFPQMMVVAIVNTDRPRDLTPSNYLLGPNGEPISEFKTSGGGEKFAVFIENELIPYVDSSYPTDPHKILMGHSLGGLAVLNMLLNHPLLFDAYVAIDPSMWWDEWKLLPETREALKQKKFNGKSLFLGIANTMPQGMNIKDVRNDTSPATNHIRSVFALADILEHHSNDGLKWSYRYYDDHDHGSVTAKAAYDALEFLFAT
jgi:uncharacterized protein